MKKLPFTLSAYLLFSSLLIVFSCKTSSTSFEFLQPADLNIPEHIDVIATLDRSKPESGWLTTLEGLFSGEAIHQDRSGRQRALEGIGDVLSRTPRFQFINTGIEMTGSKTGTSFPRPLPWNEVNRICNTFKADALLTIEFFDSNAFVTSSKHSRKKKDKNGNEFEEIYFKSKSELNIVMGWRLYDPKNKSIIDQYTTRDDISDSAEGHNEVESKRNLRSSRAVVDELSFIVGTIYGNRIAPVWVTMSRTFYKTTKGSAKEIMEKASKYAKSGEWNQAAEFWRNIIGSSAENKDKGRAAHNMAVANERAGKLNSALDWAKKAYFDFDFKPSKAYIDILRRRIEDQKRLEEQMRSVEKP